MDVNPFRYSSPVGGDDLVGRDAELEQLQRTAEEGNNSRLVAPRRFGKTSLLRQLVTEARSDGWEAVYVDFFGVLTLTDVAARLERAYRRDLSGVAGRWFDGVRRTLQQVEVGAGPVRAGVSLRPDVAALQDRLDLPRKLHERHGRRTLVVFDEFQSVLAAQNEVDALIRAEIQHHGDAASYVFAGSHVGMMRELFGDRRRAFYAQAREIELPRLDPEAATEFVVRRFADTGRDPGAALTPLLDLADGHPQRTVLLAHGVWEATPAGQVADEATFAEAVTRVMTEQLREFEGTWTALAVGQRRVLTRIAEGVAGLYSGDEPGGRSGSNRTAVRALADRGEVVPDRTTRTGYRVVDPLLALWLRSGRPQVWPDE
jgi:uncharacterized protein